MIFEDLRDKKIKVMSNMQRLIQKGSCPECGMFIDSWKVSYVAELSKRPIPLHLFKQI